LCEGGRFLAFLARSYGWQASARQTSLSKIMKYVYLLRSIPHPDQRYIGITDDLSKRLNSQNSGGSPHTSKFRPWEIVVAIRFDHDSRAAAFEHYLKSGSGREFANRHFW